MMKWQSIETAPKDGTEIDLLFDIGRYPDCKWTEPYDAMELGEEGWCQYRPSEIDSFRYHWFSILEEPIGWLPIPLPPAPGEQPEPDAALDEMLEFTKEFEAQQPEPVREAALEALTLIERVYYMEDKPADWRAATMNGIARDAQNNESLSKYQRLFPRTFAEDCQT